MSSEFDRLSRANRRLKLALAGILALGAVGAAGGMGQQSTRQGFIGITSDGEHLYRMRENGAVERINIAAAEAIDQRARAKARNLNPPEPGRWERFIWN